MIDFNLLKSNLLKQKVLPILNTSNLSQDKEIVEKALSPESLTTLVMTRLLLIEKVNRAVSNAVNNPPAVEKELAELVDA